MNSEKIRETNNQFRDKILSGEIKNSELSALAVWLNEVNNFLIEYDKYIAEKMDKLIKLP